MGKRRKVVISGTDPDDLKIGDTTQLDDGAGAQLPPAKEELELEAPSAEAELDAPKEEEQLPAGKVYQKVKHAPGKKYLKAKARIAAGKLYSLEEAIALIKDTSPVSFDATVEVHLVLGTNPDEQNQRIRTVVSLPHGTGKDIKVLVFADEHIAGADMMGDEALIEALSSGQLKPGDGFDKVVATPVWMPKLAKLGRVLGPAGLLPSPKTGTLTDDPARVVASLKKGQIELKIELTQPLLHAVIGKVSFTPQQLIENFKAVLAALESARPAKVRKENLIKKVTLTSTMGPGVLVSL